MYKNLQRSKSGLGINVKVADKPSINFSASLAASKSSSWMWTQPFLRESLNPSCAHDRWCRSMSEKEHFNHVHWGNSCSFSFSFNLCLYSGRRRRTAFYFFFHLLMIYLSFRSTEVSLRYLTLEAP